MTPDQIQQWLTANMHRMDQPAQFIGEEPNAVRKPWAEAEVRWLIAASWPYFHSAGNQSIPAVYQAVNDNPGFLADLSYLPETPRDLSILERAGIPVFGIESKQPLPEFDVVGTSISYTVLFMNFCKTLQMSGLPLRWRDREAQGLENFPMVIIGGQAFCAPGAMEPVADCFWLGEVEDEEGNGGISQVCSRIAMFKGEGTWQSDRLACYRALALEFNYLFFPRFVAVEYATSDRGLAHPSKQVSGYRSLLPGMAVPFRSRRVKDMDQIKPLRSAPLLFSDPAMGAGDLEVARGCPAWCAFCRLTYVQKPYRQRSVGVSVRHAAEWVRNMGSVELSPFSPDFPMHTQKKELLTRLLTGVSDEVDTTAMRVDDFIADAGYIMLQALGGSDGVTLGLEGNSQRMRDLVGKGTSDADVEEAVYRGIRAGMRKFKLFMINNLPGEDEHDVFRIVRLARRLAAIRDELGQPNVRFQFSWTPLLIEAKTPFQWFAPTPPDHTLIDVADLFRDLKVDFKIGTKAEPNKIALFQLAQRASREVGEAIVDVLAALDTACWGGVPRDMRDRLEAALIAHGFANGFGDCFDERFRGDLFGWEYIDTGVSEELLWRVYSEMVEFLEGTDSKTYDDQIPEQVHGNEWVGRCDKTCLGKTCGACDHKDLKLRTRYVRAADTEVHLAALAPVDLTSVAAKLRVRFTRPARYRFVGTSHWRYAVRRAAFQAAYELRGELPEGANIAKRSIRFASDPIAHKDWTAGTDYVEFGLTRELDIYGQSKFLAKMGVVLAPWLTLGAWEAFPPSVALGTDAVACYDLEVDTDSDTLSARLAAWEAAEHVKLVLRTDSAYFGTGSEEVNAKDLVSGLWPVRDGHKLRLRMLVHGKAGPYQVAAALLGKASWIDLAARPAYRLDWFAPERDDMLRAPCVICGGPVPEPLLGSPAPSCLRCASAPVLVGAAR